MAFWRRKSAQGRRGLARALSAALLSLSAFWTFPAGASDLYAPGMIARSPAAIAAIDPANRFETRFGVFAHGVGSVEEGTVSLNGELVTPRLFAPSGTWSFLVPRLHFGGFAHLSGLTNVAYTGLVWTVPVFDRVFVEAFIGPAIHDGVLQATATRSGLGCKVLFNAGGSIGYRFDDHWSIMFTFDHLSNGKGVFGINCGTNQTPSGSNQGLNNYGIRIGYAF